uniref:Protein kinase domain-containing protein n=1 Tax=Kalanchoe fedtschenkoi TaxID=63787 RepID=A0A7N0R9S8_KALFE
MLQRRNSLMLEGPLAANHCENQLVLCCEEGHDHESCSADSYTESWRSFGGEARHQLPFRVKCPIMSRILSTAMAVIDRTSSKGAIRYRRDSSGDLSLQSDLTCYESCFDDQSEAGDGSSFFNYLEKNFSRPRVRQEYALRWPQPKTDINLYLPLKDSNTAEDENLFSIVPCKCDSGQIKLYSVSHSEALQAIEDELLSESCDSKYDDDLSLFSDSDEKASDSLDSSYMMELAQSAASATPGWPLCQIPVSKTPQYRDVSTEEAAAANLQLVPVTKSLSWRLFGLDELKTATAEFSEDNLIGRGGCSKVYKGCLPDGEVVAVKVLKQNKNASKDFYAAEMDIISSLKHKHITAFLGACFESDQHIFVYDFMPEGSLDEHLHCSEKKSPLTWELRYNVAVVIAEALSYLHNECPQPVIHRDVKSSNILLSSDFQPQLSDFGLAIWGPNNSREYHASCGNNLVGTFGYIAPEYFMHGEVSDKVDVYSFGVVLLELVTGKKPIIGSVGVQGQQSLVKWAKPMMDSGDIRALADPNLAERFNMDQMQRMVSAAALCTSQSARARPSMSEVLKLLNGETTGQELTVTQAAPHHMRTWSDDDEFWIASELDRGRMSLALMDTDDDEPAAIISTPRLKRRSTMADFLERSH